MCDVRSLCLESCLNSFLYLQFKMTHSHHLLVIIFILMAIDWYQVQNDLYKIKVDWKMPFSFWVAFSIPIHSHGTITFVCFQFFTHLHSLGTNAVPHSSYNHPNHPIIYLNEHFIVRWKERNRICVCTHSGSRCNNSKWMHAESELYIYILCDTVWVIILW